MSWNADVNILSDKKIQELNFNDFRKVEWIQQQDPASLALFVKAFPLVETFTQTQIRNVVGNLRRMNVANVLFYEWFESDSIPSFFPALVDEVSKFNGKLLKN